MREDHLSFDASRLATEPGGGLEKRIDQVLRFANMNPVDLPQKYRFQLARIESRERERLHDLHVATHALVNCLWKLCQSRVRGGLPHHAALWASQARQLPRFEKTVRTALEQMFEDRTRQHFDALYELSTGSARPDVKWVDAALRQASELYWGDISDLEDLDADELLDPEAFDAEFPPIRRSLGTKLLLPDAPVSPDEVRCDPLLFEDAVAYLRRAVLSRLWEVRVCANMAARQEPGGVQEPCANFFIESMKIRDPTKGQRFCFPSCADQESRRRHGPEYFAQKQREHRARSKRTDD